MIRIELGQSAVSISKALQRLHQDQMPFILALTATRLAQQVKAGTLKVMKQRLDRPTRTTMNSLFVKMATKRQPTAQVYFKDSWTSGIPADAYLQPAVRGGVRPHKRFEKALQARGLMKAGQYAVPNPNLLNQYGNVSRGTITKVLSGLGAAETSAGYQANATGSRRSTRVGNARRYFAGVVDDAPGVWERMGSAFGEGVRPVFLFTDGAPRYRTIFPFFKMAENIVKANNAREVAAAFDDAMASAKR